MKEAREKRVAKENKRTAEGGVKMASWHILEPHQTKPRG